MNVSTQVRHLLTFLAGIGTMLLTWNLIAPEQVAAVNKAGGDMIEPLVIILGAVAAGLFRLLISWAGTIFRRGAGEENDDSGKGRPGGAAQLLLLMGTAAVLMGCLPSCSNFPVKVTAILEEGALSYSSKGGLEMEYRPGYGEMPAVYREK
jgi:hypothetical protein